jgi:hypothetical protein
MILHRLFQHHRLYKQVFTTEQALEKNEVAVRLETPLVSPPLAEALTLEDFEFQQRRKEHEAEFEKERTKKLFQLWYSIFTSPVLH